MRIETTTRKLYTFDELSDKAKDKALDETRYWNIESIDWWEYTYEDAAAIGLEITSFELDRNKHATGNLTLEPFQVVKAILENHGKDCDTYKFAKLHDGITDGDYPEDFERDLLAIYANMLQEECDYLISDECIRERFENDDSYEFTEDGRIA